MAETRSQYAKLFGDFTDWLNQAGDLERRFRDAGLSPPEPLLLNHVNGNGVQVVTDLNLPPLDVPPTPPGYAPDWIFVRLSELRITNCVLSMLRVRSMAFREIRADAKKLFPKLNDDTLYNVFKRNDKKIRREVHGYSLIDLN